MPLLQTFSQKILSLLRSELELLVLGLVLLLLRLLGARLRQKLENPAVLEEEIEDLSLNKNMREVDGERDPRRFMEERGNGIQEQSAQELLDEQ